MQQCLRGLKRDRTAAVVIRGHAFMQNLRRGHYELGTHALPGLTVAAAFDELTPVVTPDQEDAAQRRAPAAINATAPLNATVPDEVVGQGSVVVSVSDARVNMSCRRRSTS
jgi:hypothetical protein